MKHKTAELEGALLDQAVAKAEGLAIILEVRPTNPPKPAACWRAENGKPMWDLQPYRPSVDWATGGPIIERERIAVVHLGDSWLAECPNDAGRAKGDIPLIAAMRAYVASKLGDEVDLP